MRERPVFKMLSTAKLDEVSTELFANVQGQVYMQKHQHWIQESAGTSCCMIDATYFSMLHDDH
jgi:hypothetical protein